MREKTLIALHFVTRNHAPFRKRASRRFALNRMRFFDSARYSLSLYADLRYRMTRLYTFGASRPSIPDSEFRINSTAKPIHARSAIHRASNNRRFLHYGRNDKYYNCVVKFRIPHYAFRIGQGSALRIPH